MRHRSLFLLVPFLCAPFVFAQRSQPSPGVGNAVLLATNSIQIDRDSVVVSGDVIVNRAPIGPVLGGASLSIDRSVTTPAGYKLAATSITIDRDTVAGGDVYYNTLTNSGTIAGTRFTPLALPVFASLPPALIRPAGSTDVAVPNNGTLTLDEGAYRDVTIGRGARLTLSGGGYTFRSIAVDRGGELRYAKAADVVVSGRVDLGSDGVISPADGSGMTSAAMRMQVDGLNGTNGALQSTPPSIHAGTNSKLFATLYATGGSLVIDRDSEGNGAFLARDIQVSRGGRFTINSAFNSPPTADPQIVFTNGTSPLQITLTGSDPEGSALAFSIVSGPTAGTLSAPVQASATSANVTYTPAAANAPASFTFRVRDTSGAAGDAVVTINPTQVDAPPTPTTVTAIDSSAQVTKEIAATLLLRATAPTGVTVTFSIVSGSGPSHGSLGAVTGSTVVYTPAAGYTGPDAFQFQACGLISNVNVCSIALFTITVQEPPADPPNIAHDVRITTPGDTPVLISLGDSSIQTAQRRLVAPKATTLVTATVAGNVADANNDGFGDNANALPGPTPIFMSAGVNQSGGAGSNGTVRMQFEWDMANISGSIASLTSADVLLPTNRGTIDSLDTSFYWVTASGDGSLTNSDFESPAQPIAGAVMPVPPGMPIGTDGTFSFSVLSQLRSSSTFNFFAVQGRVDESLVSSARGLQVRTTASGNVTSNAVPTLALATSTVTQLQYRITSLPASGFLLDGTQPITSVPYDLSSPQVTYTPNTGFLGLDSFAFSVSNGVISSSALAKITVFLNDCAHNVVQCNNGRF
jgi:hypothetical protein